MVSPTTRPNRVCLPFSSSARSRGRHGVQDPSEGRWKVRATLTQRNEELRVVGVLGPVVRHPDQSAVDEPEPGVNLILEWFWSPV